MRTMAAGASNSGTLVTAAVFMLALLAGELLLAAPAAADRRLLQLQGLGNRRILQGDQCSISIQERCIKCAVVCLTDDISCISNPNPSLPCGNPESCEGCWNV
ncbi:unnamed protein product [Urochloa decumbens]|uniref:Uncharacterized protein n=1 Tax=Urochloa decumbens TaxID=240449 RepID=A0ABC9G782_9POAL